MNLPPASVPLVGRDKELEQINAMLSRPDCSLLTLVGPGGIGKTRLAFEVAGQHLSAERTYWVPLQPLTSPDFIVFAIANTLDLEFYGHVPPRQQLLEYLREKSFLMVLDNFEHLLEGVPLLADLLAGAPGIRLLVTSRERLHLVEEWVVEVGGLAYPADGQTANSEQYGAITLFVERAQRVKAGFLLTLHNRAAVARICQLLGGMPLGIELAAAWIRALSCEAIAEEIAHSLDLLETSARNVVPRHRTMRAAIEPTWERLAPVERDVFMRLSVFRGGFTLDAAEQVAGASLLPLTGLVDKSLVRLNERGRYDLHELLRHFAVEKLEVAGEVETTRQSHLTYFLNLTAQVEAHNFGAEQVEWYDRAETDWDNLQAAFDYAVKSEAGLQIATALSWFFSERAHWRTGFRFLERALAANPDAPVSLRAKALHCAAPLARHFGDENQARAFCEAALALARPANDRWNIAWTLAQYAMLYWDDFGQAQAMLDEALTLFRAIDDKMGITHTLVRRFWVAYDQGDHDAMFLLLEEAEIRAREAGDLVMSGWVLCNRGQIAWRVYNDPSQAHDYFERSLKDFKEAHFPVGVRHAIIYLAEVQPTLLTVKNAQVLNEAALRWLREIAPGHRNTGFILTMLAEAAAAQGQLERAAHLLGAASRLNFEGYTPEAIARFNKNIAHICTLLGEAAFNDAWAAGSSMSFTEMVAYAIESGADLASISAPAFITADSAGKSPLTRRELEVLHLIAAGLTNGEIAAQLILAPSTIKWHINEIFSKLHVTNRAQAIARAQTLGLLL